MRRHKALRGCAGSRLESLRLEGGTVQQRDYRVFEETCSRPLPVRARFAILMGVFAIAVGYGIILPMLPFLIERLARTPDATTLSGHTGLLSGIYAIALFLFAPLWGKISDQHGRRPVILLGLIGFAGSLGLFVLVQNLPALYFGRFLAGLFAAAVTPAAYALICDHAPSEEWRAHRFALINIAGSAGSFVGPMIGGMVLGATTGLLTERAEETFVAGFLAAVVLTLLGASAVWSLVPDAIEQNDVRAKKAERGGEWSLVLRLWFIVFVTAAAVGAFEVGLSLRGKQTLGMDKFQVGMMFTECGLVMFVVQGMVLSPLIKPQITRWLLAPALLMLAVGLVLVPLASSHIAVIIDIALVAAGAGAIFPIVTYWVSFHAGQTRGANLGRVTGAASLGQALGSTTSGLLFDVSILPNAAFAVAIVIVIAGIAATLGLPRMLAGLMGRAD